jgi:hypothetical protein
MAYLPQHVIERTREWAFEYNFGEWFDVSEITDFMAKEFGYRNSTPEQYACRFVAWAVESGDFEIRKYLGQWRWIVHPVVAENVEA